MPTTAREDATQALELLEEAARKTPGELREMVGDRYSHVKEVLAEQRFQEKIRQWTESSAARARHVGEQVDQNVHQYPWYYIGGAAAAGLVIGLLLARRD